MQPVVMTRFCTHSRDARCSSSKSGKKFSKIVKIGQFSEKCTQIRAKNSLIKQKIGKKSGKISKIGDFP
jgi:hypothetical protein